MSFPFETPFLLKSHPMTQSFCRVWHLDMYCPLSSTFQISILFSYVAPPTRALSLEEQVPLCPPGTVLALGTCLVSK